jgi:hypothetical protein
VAELSAFIRRIHVEGKKHEKRLAYLKFSVETSEAANSVYQQVEITIFKGIVSRDGYYLETYIILKFFAALLFKNQKHMLSSGLLFTKNNQKTFSEALKQL